MKRYLVLTIETLVAAMPVVFMLLVYDKRTASNDAVTIIACYFLLFTVSVLSVWPEDNRRKKKDA